MNKVYISILNCYPENKYKIEAFWFVFKSFCYQIFINFPKKNWWRGQKRAQYLIVRKCVQLKLGYITIEAQLKQR